jgi:hypothetical protein
MIVGSRQGGSWVITCGEGNAMAERHPSGGDEVIRTDPT